MPLMRFKKIIVWDNESVSAGEFSSVYDVSQVSQAGGYAKVTDPADVELWVYGDGVYSVYDKASLGTGEHIFWNIWSIPFEKIRFRVSAETTIRLTLFLKT